MCSFMSHLQFKDSSHRRNKLKTHLMPQDAPATQNAP